MISIILTVFKIIGFLFLALLILLLLIVLEALFVPLRYSAKLAHVEEGTSGEVRLTWMLHLISVCISFDMKGRKPGMQLRVLGISPADVKKLFRKRKKNRKQSRKQNRNQNGNTDNRANNTNRSRKAVHDSGRRMIDSRSAGTAASQKPDNQSQNAQNAEGRTDSIEKKSDINGKKTRPEADSDAVSGFRGVTRRSKLLQKILAFENRVRQIPYKVKSFIRKLQLVQKKPARFVQKLESLRRIAQKNELSELCEDLWNMLKTLLKHFRVRDGSGYLQFGTGDASVTGELTGMIYLLLPAACGGIRIQPQFTEEILRMDIQVQGHIRLIHLVRTVWNIFRNKRLRGLIRDLRTQA